MYENVKIRLISFAQHLGMNDKDFEASIGMPKCTLRRLESDVKTNVISQALRQYPQLSPDWLLCGVGPMLRPLREHPSVITATVPDDSSAGDNSEEYDDGFADLDDPDIQSALNPFAGVAEPTQPYKAENPKETITIPLVVWEQLRKQLENKDAQIATLLTVIKP